MITRMLPDCLPVTITTTTSQVIMLPSSTYILEQLGRGWNSNFLAEILIPRETFLLEGLPRITIFIINNSITGVEVSFIILSNWLAFLQIVEACTIKRWPARFSRYPLSSGKYDNIRSKTACVRKPINMIPMLRSTSNNYEQRPIENVLPRQNLPCLLHQFICNNYD